MASPERRRSKSPRRRSRSPDARRRSRSPPGRPKKSSDGFRWKKKSGADERNDGQRERRDNRDDSYRPRRYQDKESGARNDNRKRHPREQDSRRSEGSRNDSDRSVRREGQEQDMMKKPSASAAKPPAQPLTFIKVFVNDRLGTKAQIPCLPSDTVGDFKKLVAAYIGRAPHEIMIKRQGERPFKDIITLEDYGVSDGVQLDLELDTGE